MARLEARIAALERIVDAVTHRITWEDVVIVHFEVVDSDGPHPEQDCYYAEIQDGGYNRGPYAIECSEVARLMREHGYKTRKGEPSAFPLWLREDQADDALDDPVREAPSPIHAALLADRYPVEQEPVEESVVEQEPRQRKKVYFAGETAEQAKVPRGEGRKLMKWWEWMGKIEEAERKEDSIEDG